MKKTFYILSNPCFKSINVNFVGVNGLLLKKYGVRCENRTELEGSFAGGVR